MKKFIALFLVSFWLVAVVHAKPKNYGDAVVEKLLSVYDGDTFKANIKDLPPIIGENIGIRIAGIDAPELRTKNMKLKALALVAKEFLVTLLESAKEIVLKNMFRDKYFRIVANVFVDGEDVGKKLLNAKLAQEYDGKKKKPWLAE
jgi:endonuclease YncB( thermonuclease family)